MILKNDIKNCNHNWLLVQKLVIGGIICKIRCSICDELCPTQTSSFDENGNRVLDFSKKNK